MQVLYQLIIIVMSSDMRESGKFLRLRAFPFRIYSDIGITCAVVERCE